MREICVLACARERQRGDRVRKERPRQQRAARLLENDACLEHARTLAAERFRDGHAEQPKRGHLLPERGIVRARHRDLRAHVDALTEEPARFGPDGLLLGREGEVHS